MLGTDSESPAESSIPETPTALDPTAAALAAEAAKNNSELAHEASAYFRKQSHLVEIQTEHLHEQRAVNLQLLKLKRFDERLRVALRLFVILVATAVGIGALILVRNAMADHGLMVEAFSVPPDLAQQGITGRVVAAEFIDQISLLQSKTHTSRPLATFRNNWGDDIKVEIPETGVSIAELSRLLHEHLGSATRIEGEVTHTQTGLSIVARLPEVAALRVSGAPGELDTLVQRIAEQAFASTQPYRYGIYLFNLGRRSEALAVFRDLAERGPSEERPWGYVGVGLASAELSGYEEALAAWRESLRLDPNQAISSTNLAEVARGVGLDEEALAESKRYQSLSSGALAQHFTAPALAWGNLLMKYLQASELGDHQAGIRFARSMVTDTVFNAGADKSYGAFAREELALNHDVAGGDDKVSDAEATAGLVDDSDYYVVIPNVLAAFERGDMATVETLCTELARALEKPGTPVTFQQQIQRRIYPVLAEALAHMGRYGEADALAAQIPNNAYDGWRARAHVATLRGDFEAGEKALAEAVRQAPSIPRAFSDWGDLLAAKGDLAGALIKYAEANRLGPHFADPLKGWGNVLMKQGKIGGALAKYNEALKYAPNWKELKDAREKALKMKT